MVSSTVHAAGSRVTRTVPRSAVRGVFRGGHSAMPPLADGENFLKGLKTGGRADGPPFGESE
jgi:hypothetical protein